MLLTLLFLSACSNSAQPKEENDVQSIKDVAIKVPENINMTFLGLVDLTQKSLILALLAGVSQYFQAYYMPKPPASTGESGGFAESFSKSMQMQMKYIFPVMIFLILYTDFLGSGSAGAAIALYWITSNIFSIGQQIYANKKMLKVSP